jgi:type IV secretory pathway VirB10-like protein
LGYAFKAAVLSTLLSVGAETGASQDEDNLVQAIRSGASNSISQTDHHRAPSQHPTDVVHTRGLPVRVIVMRDLVLAPYGQGRTQ